MKAVYYNLEAVIAAFLVMGIFLLLFFSIPKSQEVERANLKTDIYRGLEILNEKGSLRVYALENNATTIKNDLRIFLPISVSSHVTIFNKTFNSLTTPFTEETSDTISVSYAIAGNVGNYTPKEIRVYVWGFE